jgi:twinkle protein
LIWRNKKKEHDAQLGPVDKMVPDAMMMCEKQRNGESEDWYSFWFERSSQQFVEYADSVPMKFDNGEFYVEI